MATSYPIRIDTVITLPSVIDNFTPIRAVTVNSLRDAILAIEGALGAQPAATYGTVAGRLTAIETAQTNTGNGNAISLQSIPISTVIPMNNQILEYNADTLMWTPVDASFTNIQGIPIEIISLPPPQSAVLVYDTLDGEYNIRQLTLDDLGPAFAITSFTGGLTVEIGATVTDPYFSAGYSSVPSSAQIINSDNIDSPLVLLPPYTFGTIIGSFTHNTQTSVTFNLKAVGVTTQNAYQYIAYLPSMFGGIGFAGATSAITNAGNTALLNTGDILANEGLYASPVGYTFGPFSPSEQKIYLLLTGNSHIFKDQNGFLFPMNNGGPPTTISFSNLMDQLFRCIYMKALTYFLHLLPSQ